MDSHRAGPVGDSKPSLDSNRGDASTSCFESEISIVKFVSGHEYIHRICSRYSSHWLQLARPLIVDRILSRKCFDQCKIAQSMKELRKQCLCCKTVIQRRFYAVAKRANLWHFEWTYLSRGVTRYRNNSPVRRVVNPFLLHQHLFFFLLFFFPLLLQYFERDGKFRQYCARPSSANHIHSHYFISLQCRNNTNNIYIYVINKSQLCLFNILGIYNITHCGAKAIFFLLLTQTFSRRTCHTKEVDSLLFLDESHSTEFRFRASFRFKRKPTSSWIGVTHTHTHTLWTILKSCQCNLVPYQVMTR